MNFISVAWSRDVSICKGQSSMTPVCSLHEPSHIIKSFETQWLYVFSAKETE